MKKTITSIFMVPTLKIPKESLFGNGFINAYIQDVDKDDIYVNCVYLLFKPDDVDKFRSFLDNEYERTKDIIEEYDYQDGFVVVVYSLNPNFKKDFELVKKGMYSKTSEDFQKEFPKKVTLIQNGFKKEETSLQYRIFNKTDDLIEYWEDKLNIDFDPGMEVWQGFDLDNEILNIRNIKKELLKLETK